MPISTAQAPPPDAANRTMAVAAYPGRDPNSEGGSRCPTHVCRRHVARCLRDCRPRLFRAGPAVLAAPQYRNPVAQSHCAVYLSVAGISATAGRLVLPFSWKLHRAVAKISAARPAGITRYAEDTRGAAGHKARPDDATVVACSAVRCRGAGHSICQPRPRVWKHPTVYRPVAIRQADNV